LRFLPLAPAWNRGRSRFLVRASPPKPDPQRLSRDRPGFSSLLFSKGAGTPALPVRRVRRKASTPAHFARPTSLFFAAFQ
jgi:hypothetical protein